MAISRSRNDSVLARHGGYPVWTLQCVNVLQAAMAPKVLGAKLIEGAISLELSEPVVYTSLKLSRVTSSGKEVKGTWRYMPGETTAIFAPVKQVKGPLELVIAHGLMDTAGTLLSKPYKQTLKPAP